MYCYRHLGFFPAAAVTVHVETVHAGLFFHQSSNISWQHHVHICNSTSSVKNRIHLVITLERVACFRKC